MEDSPLIPRFLFLSSLHLLQLQKWWRSFWWSPSRLLFLPLEWSPWCDLLPGPPSCTPSSSRSGSSWSPPLPVKRSQDLARCHPLAILPHTPPPQHQWCRWQWIRQASSPCTRGSCLLQWGQESPGQHDNLCPDSISTNFWQYCRGF